MAKAKAPDAGWESERVIALIGGGSGEGKSFFVANLKNALIYDTDIGGGLAYADARIRRNGSERVEIASYVDVLEDLRTRLKDGRLKQFKTVAFDHVTALQQEALIRHNPAGGSDWGRAGAAATQEWRKIREFARTRDFNIIATAHLKNKYENDKNVGLIADGSKNLEADFGIVLYLHRRGAYPSVAQVMKWRRDPEDPRGPIPATFDFTMQRFEEIAGSGMSRDREEKIATSEQVAELNQLLEVVKLPDSVLEKWESAGDFEDMPESVIADRITYCNGLLAKTKKGVV